MVFLIKIKVNLYLLQCSNIKIYSLYFYFFKTLFVTVTFFKWRWHLKVTEFPLQYFPADLVRYEYRGKLLLENTFKECQYLYLQGIINMSCFIQLRSIFEIWRSRSKWLLHFAILFSWRKEKTQFHAGLILESLRIDIVLLSMLRKSSFVQKFGKKLNSKDKLYVPQMIYCFIGNRSTRKRCYKLI